MNIAVLGAGYVGGAIAEAFAGSGAAVWAVRRRPAPAEGTIRWCQGDFTTGAVDGLPPTLDAVVLSVAPGAAHDGYAAVYPPGARAALALASRTGAAMLVYTSSTGVYGGRDGEWVEETTPRAGAGPANQALIEAEDILLDAGREGVTVLRVAGIYGPGRDPRPRFRTPETLAMHGEYWVNLAHRDDLVAAVRDAVYRRGGPAVLNVADGSPARAAEISRWLAEVEGSTVASLRFTGEGAPTRSNQRVATAALCATGWCPRFPSFREGFGAGLGGAGAL